MEQDLFKRKIKKKKKTLKIDIVYYPSPDNRKIQTTIEKCTTCKYICQNCLDYHQFNN